MQNVVNYLSPFLYNGKPIAGGRVYFIKADTSALTFEFLSGLDSAFFIPVYDRNKNLLENPVTLNDEGTWDWANGRQPFVDDGIDFKMIVCRPTGISPDINDETPAWEVCYTVASIADRFEMEYEGIVKVGSVAELRTQDPSAGAVLVLGYGGANDFCPPRIFSWKRQNLSDNGGTHIRSTLEGQTNAGTWVCEPTFCVDVRWFGINPNPFSQVDIWSMANTITQNYYPNLPLYFPAGSYFLTSDIEFVGGLILDRNANLYPINNDITVKADFFENRGGKFCRTPGTRNYKIKPLLKGTVCTSWMDFPRFQLDGANLDDVTELVVDSDIPVAGAGKLEISQKFVYVKAGVNVAGASFSNCVVLYEANSAFEANYVLAKFLYLQDRASFDITVENEIPRVRIATLGQNGAVVATFGIDTTKILSNVLECKKVNGTEFTFKENDYYGLKKDGTLFTLNADLVRSLYEQIPYFRMHKVPAYYANYKFARLEFQAGGVLMVKEPYADHEYGVVGVDGEGGKVFDLNALVTDYGVSLFAGAENWDLFIDTQLMGAYQPGQLIIILPSLVAGTTVRLCVSSSDDKGLVRLVTNETEGGEHKFVKTFAGGVGAGAVVGNAPTVKLRPMNLMNNNVNDWLYYPFMR